MKTYIATEPLLIKVSPYMSIDIPEGGKLQYDDILNQGVILEKLGAVNPVTIRYHFDWVQVADKVQRVILVQEALDYAEAHGVKIPKIFGD